MCIFRWPLHLGNAGPIAKIPRVPASFCLSHREHLYDGGNGAGDWLYLLRCAHRFDPRLLVASRKVSGLPDEAMGLLEYWIASGPLAQIEH